MNQNKLEESQMRVQEAAVKQQNREIIRRGSEELRYLRQEEIQERRKGQVEMLAINTNGLPIVYTENVYAGKKERVCSNIYFPYITEVRRLENESDFVYVFQGITGQLEKRIVLNPAQCGCGSYVIRALGSIGGQIYASKAKLQKQYAVFLITYLISECMSIVKVPDYRGWYLDEEKNIFFFEGESWKELEKCVVR